jgi:hypothetical protein
VHEDIERKSDGDDGEVKNIPSETEEGDAKSPQFDHRLEHKE